MGQSNCILGFEPAIQTALKLLLAREPGLTVVDETYVHPDKLLISPRSPTWIAALRDRYPGARMVALLEWHRGASFPDELVDQWVDGLANYQDLLQQLKL